VNPFLIFNVQVTMYCVVFGLATAWYVMPRLRAMDQHAALVVPLLVSSLRVTGLLFLVPHLNVDMPAAFAVPAGYGDAAVAVLAFFGALANRARSPLGVPLAWAYAVLGGADLAYGFFQGFRYDMFSHLGGAWPAILVAASAMICALGTLFTLLMRPNPAMASRRLATA
jgi:hypothetical protein